MKPARRVYQHHIGSVGLGRGQSVERHRRRVRAHLLPDHRGARTVGPYLELVDGGRTERIGGTYPHLAARLGELRRQLSDGRGFARTVHTNHHHHIGFAGPGIQPEIVGRAMGLFQQGGYLFAQDVLQFRRIHVFVAGGPFFDAADNLDGRLHPHIGGHKHFFQVVQHFRVDSRTSRHSAGQFAEQPGLGLLQPRIEFFLTRSGCFPTVAAAFVGSDRVAGFLFENIENRHIRTNCPQGDSVWQRYE